MPHEKQQNDRPQSLRSKVEQHYLRYLGEPTHTWINDLYKFKVQQFDDVPCPGATTYATVGLADFPLMRPTGVESRQELVFSCYSRFSNLHVEDLLFVVGGDLVEERRALRKGEVLGPAGPLLTGASVEALFCTSHPFFSEDLDQISMPMPIVIVGLVPITRAEAKFAVTHGWSSLEEALSEHDTDILDLQRKSIPVCDTL